GWSPITFQGGFLNSFRQARPSILAGVQTASWTFTGLIPGLYRVFATWKSAPANSTSAPYSIFDSTTQRATLFVDQQRAPTNGPRDGGVVFQQLGDAVNIPSSTLKVQLSNQVPLELQDGANVIADAVRIERLAGIVSPGRPGASDTLEVTTIILGPGSTY